MRFNPCLLIPHYNHHQLVGQVIEKLKGLRLPLILVDDGSSRESFYSVQRMVVDQSWIKLLHHASNRGKGAAILTGLRYARRFSYTHAVQIDADGQHNCDDVPRLLALARQSPESIISGFPIFGKDMPRSRYYGRLITHLLVIVETLSLSVRDSMCGFRVYPVVVTNSLFDKYFIGARMDFDTEVMVKANWSGTTILYLPTPVVYPKSGISHFDYIHDNVFMVRMHCRLLLGMLFRLPYLIRRRNSVS